MHQDNAQPQLGMAFIVGLGVGYVTSLLLPEKTQEKARDTFTKSAKQIGDGYYRWEGVRQAKSNMMDTYFETRQSIMDQLKEAEETWEGVNKRKYGNLVRKTLDQMVEEGKIPSESLDTLQQYLLNDFQSFRNGTENNA